MLLAEPALHIATPAHQRVDGAARIRFGADSGRTRLADLYQRAPCRVLFPDVDPTEPIQAVLLTTSGGLTGGDALRVQLSVEASACATLTTQAAEKIYRALPGDDATRIDVHIDAGDAAYVEWLAQETILFDAARLRRSLVAELAPTARLLAVESIVFGRSAMGESVCSGFLHDVWRIRRGGRLIFADALHLDGEIAALRALPFGFGNALACATLVHVGADAAALRDLLRTELAQFASIMHAGAREDLLIVRVLAADAALLRRAVVAAAAALRHASMGLPRRLPQVWYC